MYHGQVGGGAVAITAAPFFVYQWGLGVINCNQGWHKDGFGVVRVLPMGPFGVEMREMNWKVSTHRWCCSKISPINQFLRDAFGR